MTERHSVKVLNSLNRFRCSGHLCDVTLKVGAKQFDAHKTVLAASSPYFEAMFQSCMEESEKKDIEIKGIL